MLLPLLLPTLLVVIVATQSEENNDSCFPSNSLLPTSELVCQEVERFDPTTSAENRVEQPPLLPLASKRIKRQMPGRANLGGCGNPALGQIMNHVVMPLTTNTRMRLGDVAKILQTSVQQATGQAHEVIMGRGDMVLNSQQMNPGASCRLRVGDLHVTAYETPVAATAQRYDINNEFEERWLSSVDFGEPLGSSGYEGQLPWPRLNPVETLLINSEAERVRLLYGVFGPAECFSGDLIVQTSEGPKRMRDLQTGDEVLSIDETMVMFSPILMFQHRDENVTAEFNVITVSNGDSVKLTNEHLIYVTDCEPSSSSMRLVRAKNVTTEHCVMVARFPGRLLVPDRVVNVSKTIERGIYAPLTLTGDLFVNDVLASCHSSLAVRTLQDGFFVVYRFLASLFLPDSLQNGELPYGLSFFSNALDLFIPSRTVMGY